MSSHLLLKMKGRRCMERERERKKEEEREREKEEEKNLDNFCHISFTSHSFPLSSEENPLPFYAISHSLPVTHPFVLAGREKEREKR